MLDIKVIRDNQKAVEKGLLAKKVDVDLSVVLKYDQKRRDLLVQLDELRSQKNTANDEISRLLKAKKDPKKKIASMKSIAKKIDVLEPKVKKIQSQVNDILIGIPNLPHTSVPVGGADQNKKIRSWGTPKRFDFKPKTHIEL